MFGVAERRYNETFLQNNVYNSQTIYKNLKRKYGDIQAHSLELPALKRRKQDLEEQKKRVKGIENINLYQDLSNAIQKIAEDIKNIEEKTQQQMIFEKATALLRGANDQHDTNMIQMRDAVAMTTFFEDKTIPVFVQTNNCPSCHTRLRHHVDESILVCNTCSYTKKFIPLNSDHQDINVAGQDTIENHLQSTISNNIIEDSIPSDHSTTEKKTEKEKSAKKRSFVYDTVEYYERTIYPFLENQVGPADEEYEIILRELCNIHIVDASKVTNSIAGILKKTGLSKWSWMEDRITMTVTAKDIKKDVPVFSTKLYNRLKERYKLFISALHTIYENSRAKILNPRYLTRIFLFMENEPHMARCFHNQRTTTDLKKKERVLRRVVEHFRENPTKGYEWKMIRSV